MNIRIANEECDETYPGKRAAVICLQGCNLKCIYCFCSNLIRKGEVSDQDFSATLSQLRSLKPNIDAVVVTGGEPTVHANLPKWLGKLKKLGLSVLLETNGTHPEMLRELIHQELIDRIHMDVKATPENYATVSGVPVDADAIKQSIWIIRSSGLPHQFATTLVPGFHTIREIRKIAGMVRGADRYVVRDFVSENALRPELRGRAAFPHKPIESVRYIIERKVKDFSIEGNAEAIRMIIPGRRKRRRRTEIEKEKASA